MKKKFKELFRVSSIIVFLISLSALGHLSHGEPVDDEVSHLIQNAPTAELYPDAGVITIPDMSV